MTTKATKDYELLTSLREDADNLREELNNAAIEGEEASELLAIAQKLVSTLEKMNALQK